MADKKYLSKISKDGDTIYIKDTEAQASLLFPVDISSLTPSSTFTTNSVIGINGVLYRCTADTSDFPVTLQTDGEAFVTHTVNGKTSFVVADETLSSDWEIFTDASVEYWKETLETRVSALENLSVTYEGTTYTLAQLLTAMAELMTKTVVVNE